MYTVKLSLVLMSFLTIHCAPVGTSEENPKMTLMISASLGDLQKACDCKVEKHPLFESLQSSLSGDVEQFLKSQKACGFVGVDERQQKGWLFASPECTKIKSLAQIGFIR